MSRLDFHFEFHSELPPETTRSLRTKAERRLQALATDQRDMIGASVAVRELTRDETPHQYQARVVAYIRPENLAAVEKGDVLDLTLVGAIDALERQVLARREKFRQPWEQPDRAVNTGVYELTPRELYDAYANGANPAALVELDRDRIAGRLILDEHLDQEAAYYVADQILLFAEETMETE